jgi:hypothetical protein
MARDATAATEGDEARTMKAGLEIAWRMFRSDIHDAIETADKLSANLKANFRDKAEAAGTPSNESKT